MIRGGLARAGAVVTLAAVALPAPAARATPARALLVLSGAGGQTATLTVPRAGTVVEYPFFAEPRLRGPDGTVGGLVIQRADGRVVGGVLLLNVPGFDRAVDVPLVGYDRTRLPSGRYRLTLLGSVHQAVHVVMVGATGGRALAARGAAVPITRTVTGPSRAVDAWTDQLGRVRASDYLVVGAGSSGDEQQADESDLCVQSEASVGGAPCLGGQGIGITPGPGGAGSWSGALYAPGDLEPGPYVFTGHAAGVGPSSLSAHVGVVVSPRR